MQSIYLIWHTNSSGARELTHIISDGIGAAQYCTGCPTYDWEEWIQISPGERFIPQTKLEKDCPQINPTSPTIDQINVWKAGAQYKKDLSASRNPIPHWHGRPPVVKLDSISLPPDLVDPHLYSCNCSVCRPDLYKETVKVYPAPGLYKTGEAIKLEHRDTDEEARVKFQETLTATRNKLADEIGTPEAKSCATMPAREDWVKNEANLMGPTPSRDYRPGHSNYKLSITALPQIGIVLGAEAMRDGDYKHGPYNWLDTPISARLLIDGTLRHLFAWMGGEEKASDSGVHHLGHCIARLSILLDAQANGTLIDDRPVKKVK